MKKFDIQPTEENLTSSFVSDFLGRDSYILSLVEILNALEGSFSIAIDGSWGSGKTFAVKQTKMLIDALNSGNPFSESETGKEIVKKWKQLNNSTEVSIQPMITTYYDAWEHDDEEDPILSIVYEMMQENYCIDKIPNKRDWPEILKNIANFVGKKKLATLIKNANSVVDSVQGQDYFSSSKNTENMRHIINDFIKSLLPEAGNKLIVFVDELDRCNPNYAVKLLERIKHYMQNESVVFVFALNQVELEKTVRHFYGPNFDACRYLDRFFDYRLGLPEVDLERYFAMLGASGHMNLRQTTCFEFVRQTGMSLREIPKLLVGSKMATFKITDSKDADRYPFFHFENKNASIIALDVITPIAIGLKLHNTDSYMDFISGRNSKWLKQIVMSDSLFSWVFNMLLENNVTYVKRAEITDEEASERIQELYEAIFVKTYDNGFERETRVGKVAVDRGIKLRILEAVNFVSKYRDFSVV